MKYIIIFLLTLCIGYSQTSAAYNPATDVSSGAQVKTSIKHPYYRESKGSYDLYISSGVYIYVLNTGLTTTWFANGANAKQLQYKYGFDLTMNGAYFTYDGETDSFMPAGRIVDGLRVIRSMVKEFFSDNLDANLYITILYNKLTNKVTISDQDIVVPQDNLYSFYAGPQLISSGSILPTISKKTSHRQRKATRTFMIIDKDGNPHLGATIQGYSLPDLAKKIQEMKIFYGQYHVINMDGGSSTSFAAGTRYWNSSKRLPWFFGVK